MEDGEWGVLWWEEVRGGVERCASVGLDEVLLAGREALYYQPYVVALLIAVISKSLL